METTCKRRGRVSPMRTLESLEARFGAFTALAYASLAAGTRDGEDIPPMNRVTAWAILEFGDDLRRASRNSVRWARAEGLIPFVREGDETPG